VRGGLLEDGELSTFSGEWLIGFFAKIVCHWEPITRKYYKGARMIPHVDMKPKQEAEDWRRAEGNNWSVFWTIAFPQLC